MISFHSAVSRSFFLTKHMYVMAILIIPFRLVTSDIFLVIIMYPVKTGYIIYRRYIDDTFLFFKSASHIPKFLHYLNSKHSSIKFTCDVETNSKLNFLDILIHNNLNKFETSVYRKPTFTGLGMKFNSFIPPLLFQK